jgi:hypothetical protein
MLDTGLSRYPSACQRLYDLFAFEAGDTTCLLEIGMYKDRVIKIGTADTRAVQGYNDNVIRCEKQSKNIKFEVYCSLS